MGAPEPFNPLAVEGVRPGPALGGAQDDHRPDRPAGLVGSAFLLGALADLLEPADDLIHGGRHRLVHRLRFAAFHKQRLPAVAPQQAAELCFGDAGQQGWVGDLVAVEVQHGQHHPIAERVQELVDVPAGGQGAGLRLPIADTGNGDQIRVVEDRTAGMGEDVAQFAAFMDGPRRLGGAVAADVAGEGELLEEALEPFAVLGFVRIDL